MDVTVHAPQEHFGVDTVPHAQIDAAGYADNVDAAAYSTSRARQVSTWVSITLVKYGRYP